MEKSNNKSLVSGEIPSLLNEQYYYKFTMYVANHPRTVSIHKHSYNYSFYFVFLYNISETHEACVWSKYRERETYSSMPAACDSIPSPGFYVDFQHTGTFTSVT